MDIDKILEELYENIIIIKEEMKKLNNKLSSLENSLEVVKQIKYGGNIDE